MTQSRMTYSTTLKLNQRFETYEEFLNVLNTKSKNFDIWKKVDSRKNNVGEYLYVKFKCIYYNKLDSHHQLRSEYEKFSMSTKDVNVQQKFYSHGTNLIKLNT
jgi:hypothetical protein